MQRIVQAMQSKHPSPITLAITTTSDASTTPFQLTVPAQSQQPSELIQAPTGVKRSVSTDQATDRRLSAVCGELATATTDDDRRFSAVV